MLNVDTRVAAIHSLNKTTGGSILCTYICAVGEKFKPWTWLVQMKVFWV